MVTVLCAAVGTASFQNWWHAGTVNGSTGTVLEKWQSPTKTAYTTLAGNFYEACTYAGNEAVLLDNKMQFSFWIMVLESCANGLNPLNAELNPTCHLLALLGTHHILHVSRIRVNSNFGIIASLVLCNCLFKKVISLHAFKTYALLGGLKA